MRDFEKFAMARIHARVHCCLPEERQNICVPKSTDPFCQICIEGDKEKLKEKTDAKQKD